MNTISKIKGWRRIIIKTQEGDIVADISADNFVVYDGYYIRLVPAEVEEK